VAEDAPIEEAALLMIEHDIGALPVMRGEELVGIITETDLFKTFTELFAAREEGIRLTLLVPEREGELVQIAEAIAELGGDIVSLGTFLGEDMSNRLLTVKVRRVPRDQLEQQMQALGVKVIDARECLQARAC
jgi:acetoin utilization protein AcuB